MELPSSEVALLQLFVSEVAEELKHWVSLVGDLDCYKALYRPYAGGVASRLAPPLYVAIVTQILYDNSHSPMTQISSMKVISLMVDFKQTVKLYGVL